MNVSLFSLFSFIYSLNLFGVHKHEQNGSLLNIVHLVSCDMKCIHLSLLIISK